MYAISYYRTALFCFMIFLQLHQQLFLIHEKRRAHFGIRIIASEIVYLLTGELMIQLIKKQVFTPWSLLMYVIVFASSCLILAFCYDISVIDVVFGSTCGYAGQHIGSSLSTVLQYFFKIDRSNPFVRFPMDIVVQIIVAGIIYFAIIRKNSYNKERREKDVRMVALAVLMLFATICLSAWSSNDYGEVNARALFLGNVICKLYGMVICILVITMEYAISRMNMVTKQKQFMEQVLHAQGEHQKLYKESISIINRKCHDIKYQMKALQFLNAEEKRSEYIEELRQAVSFYDSVYHTENEVLNFLLREKTLLCEEYEIQFSCMADAKQLNILSDDDLYALLGNALDNAIESVLKEEDVQKRIIGLRISTRQNMLYIHLENYCKDEVKFEEGLPVTTKEDRSYHGFGVQSIKFITEKYHGNLLLQQKGTMFYLDILFPLT